MTTAIPASQLVEIVPSVLRAGGSGLLMSGLMLTTSIQPPIGTVLSFPDPDTVADYFGSSSDEASLASTYFNGFSIGTRFPSALLLAQYPKTAVQPYVRGADISGVPLATLQGYSGVLAVAVNGSTRTSGAISLAAATSYSSAASIIQTAFNSYDFTGTASIAAGGATSVTGSIAGNVLTVTAVGSGTLVAGGVLSGTGGGGVTANTKILSQLSGTTGGVGTYKVDQVQSVLSTTITQAYAILTVSAVASGALSLGQVLSGTGISGTAPAVSQLGTGTGSTGTYILSGGSRVMSSSAVSAGPLTVTYDSVSGGFVIMGGSPGAVGTIGYVAGALAVSLLLTSATGAVLSQGAAATDPTTFMNSVIAGVTNWADFMTIFNPDDYGNDVKYAFSTWTGNQRNNYMYVPWDTDVTPTLSQSAASSLGQRLINSQVSGTAVQWGPDTVTSRQLAAWVLGTTASIDFNARDGRITFAGKGQDGLLPTVTDGSVAANLKPNLYNWYGKYAARSSDLFNFYEPGQISGSFAWMDSFVDQIWLNASLQVALLNLLQSTNSIPYNARGYAMIEAVIASIAALGLNNGVISPGIELSEVQRIAIDSAAGTGAAAIVGTRGWFAQVQPATAQVRGARTSPPIKFWYADGGSVQQIEVASIEVQ